MNPPDASEPVFIQTFVDVARHQLALLNWDEIEPSLAVSWAELKEPGLPPWESVAELVRRQAQDGGGQRWDGRGADGDAAGTRDLR